MAFVGREEIRAPLKTHEGEASVAKAAKIKMKKYWLEKINKITKKLSQELCQTNPGRGYCLLFCPNLEKETSARRIRFIIVVILRTDLWSFIAVISPTLQKLQQNRPARVLTFRSNYDYSTSELWPKLIVHHRVVAVLISNNDASHCK